MPDTKKSTRSKVDLACIYCRRSHMMCDTSRPCLRCVKRNIGHLCRDPDAVKKSPFREAQSESPSIPDATGMPGGLGLEFDNLNDFMSLVDEDGLANVDLESVLFSDFPAAPVAAPQLEVDNSTPASDSVDQFMLTAADPEDTSAAGRLSQVIRAKRRAGLLTPYNYARGYDRLKSYMDSYMNSQSCQRIMHSLSVVRPSFRAVAKSLNDNDLIGVEEYFERLLLDYDRVFSAMAVPACLWRRTGEIYRGNKEFAELVKCSLDDLRDGKLAIYGLMTEESAVNYWEKYSGAAFNSDHKAILTTCNIRISNGRKRTQCCFSFTIRRDRYNIPICIAGNFIPIDPS